MKGGRGRLRLAVRTAARLAPPGPAMPRPAADEAVAQLRDLTVRPSSMSGRSPAWAEGQAGAGTVVDRAGGRRPTSRASRSARAARPRGSRERRQNPVAGRSRRIRRVLTTGRAELAREGAGPDRGVDARSEARRLLLVAPNVVETERRLGWTRATSALGRPARGHAPHQFTAVPWPHDHVRGRDRRAAVCHLPRRPAAPLGPAEGCGPACRGRLAGRAAAVAGAARRARPRHRLHEPVQGHAEYVMDGVGPRGAERGAHRAPLRRTGADCDCADRPGCCAAARARPQGPGVRRGQGFVELWWGQVGRTGSTGSGSRRRRR